MSYLQETRDAGREIFPDLARAWALIGIALVNVGVLAWPMASGYNYEGAILGQADKTAAFLVYAFFMMKSYSLFSFMFGVGFAYQMKSAERRGIGFAGRYWRRIIGLLAFGVLNAAFFFIGDILVVYAILGSLLFLFRNASIKTLITWGIIIYVIQILVIALAALGIWAGTEFAPEDMLKTQAEFAEMDAGNVAAFSAASFWDASLYRMTEFISALPMFLIFQGFGAMAFFLFGLAAVRSGVIANAAAPIWKKARHFALPVGVVVSASGAWLISSAEAMIDPPMMAGMALITLGSPLSTAGYLGLIAKWAQGDIGPVKSFFARGGTSSLTAYLMQGLIFSLTFSAYGFGQYAQWPALQCIGFALAVALFTIAFASLWRTQFKRGPLEYVLRSWTYLGAR